MSGNAPPVASVNAVWKSFQAVTALRDVSIDFHAGSVHVLFGENGAGKSTLIGLLSGIHKPDAGEIRLGGTACSITSPRHARALGISCVFQEPTLIPQLSIAENLSLGREPVKAGFIMRGRQIALAEQALDRVGSTLPLSALARDIGRADQQVVEIARALQDSARLLILDEPTAALTEDETSRLFNIMRRLRDDGIAMIYITHRMKEIRDIGDRVSVLRDGALIKTANVRDVTNDDLVYSMTGRRVEALFPSMVHNPKPGGLELSGIAGGVVRNLDLHVRRGEIVGITGLVGSGKSDIGKLIFGIENVAAGEVRVDGRQADITSPEQGLAMGIIYYPADRKQDGLIGVRSARENVTLSSLANWTHGWLLDRRAEGKAAESILRRLSLRPADPEAFPTTFSGGNQQKIVLARGFTRPYSIHVFDEPTAGVDVGARVEIYQAIKELVDSGAAVIVISSDLPEIVNLVQRAYVIAHGEVVGEFTGPDITEANMLPYFFKEPKVASA